MEEVERYDAALVKARELAEQQQKPTVVVRDVSFANLATGSGLFPYRVATQFANERFGFGPVLVTIQPKGE